MIRAKQAAEETNDDYGGPLQFTLSIANGLSTTTQVGFPQPAKFSAKNQVRRSFFCYA